MEGTLTHLVNVECLFDVEFLEGCLQQFEVAYVINLIFCFVYDLDCIYRGGVEEMKQFAVSHPITQLLDFCEVGTEQCVDPEKDFCF